MASTLPPKTDTATKDMKYLGKPRKLLEGLEKAAGRATYVGDVRVPDMLHLHPVLSEVAHARIVTIDTSEAANMPGVVAIYTSDDLVTKDRVTTSRPTTILAKDRVLFVGHPVVAIVAESEQAAQDAADKVHIEYEPLPVAVGLEEAAAPDAPVVWPDGLPHDDIEQITHAAVDESAEEASGDPTNVHMTRNYSRGDVEAGFAEADEIVEQTLSAPWVYQGYMETHGALVVPDLLKGTIEIYTSTQGQFGVRGLVSGVLGLEPHQIKVHAMTIGGGFGSKHGVIEPLVASVAYTLGRPVRWLLKRSEDFLSTTPAPACQMTIKLGAKKDGTLTALQAKVLVDNGAFAAEFGGLISLFIGSNYRVPNMLIEGLEVITNKSHGGAYRGPGAPQATFALESVVDELALKLGMDQGEFRVKNVAVGGDPMANGSAWPNQGSKLCLERLLEHPVWKDQNKGEDEGIGIAVGTWPCAFGPAASVCRIDSDGTVRIQVGSVDISGVNSSLVLVAAEMLGVSPDQVELSQGNTETGPFAPGSGGSQVTYSVSGAVRSAALDAREQLLEFAAEHMEARKEDLELVDGSVQVKGVPDSALGIAKLAALAQRTSGGPGPITGHGRVAVEENAPGTVAHLAKVKVDRDTGEVKVLQFVAVQDVGFALNPMMVEGQIHGGVVQGIGMGLFEGFEYDDSGQLMNGSFMDYAMPKSDDVPNIEVIMLENPSPYGPFGARGVGEPPITAPPAAIANAIYDAVGVRVSEIPVKPQTLWQALQDT